MAHPIRGALEIAIKSPQGTVSKLLEARFKDRVRGISVIRNLCLTSRIEKDSASNHRMPMDGPFTLYNIGARDHLAHGHWKSTIRKQISIWTNYVICSRGNSKYSAPIDKYRKYVSVEKSISYYDFLGIFTLPKVTPRKVDQTFNLKLDVRLEKAFFCLYVWFLHKLLSAKCKSPSFAYFSLDKRRWLWIWTLITDIFSFQGDRELLCKRTVHSVYIDVTHNSRILNKLSMSRVCFNFTFAYGRGFLLNSNKNTYHSQKYVSFDIRGLLT